GCTLRILLFADTGQGILLKADAGEASLLLERAPADPPAPRLNGTASPPPPLVGKRAGDDAGPAPLGRAPAAARARPITPRLLVALAGALSGLRVVVAAGERRHPVGHQILRARQIVRPRVADDAVGGLPHDLELTVVLDLAD